MYDPDLVGQCGNNTLPFEGPPPHPLQDGSSLLAGCSDGAIRLYGPQSGQLRRVLAGAHQAAVTALAVAGGGQRLYSGDASGAFKAWRLGPQSHTMLAALKEHKVWCCVAPRTTRCRPGCTQQACISACKLWIFSAQVPSP